MRFRRLEQWQINLWAIVAAELLTILAFNAALILVPYYIQQMGITDLNEVARWTGIYQATGAVAFAIATPIWGFLGDRFGRKMMLVRSMIATTTVLVLMGLARTPQQLLVLRMIQGFFTGTPAAASALVAVGSPKDRLAYGLGLVQTAVFIGASLGPMIGGYVADAWSYRSVFFAAAVLAGVSLLIVAVLTREPHLKAAPQPRTHTPALSGFRALLQTGPLLRLTAIVLVINLTLGLLGPVLPLTIQRLVSDSSRLASTAGTISGVFALSAAVAALVVGRISDHVGYARTVFICALGMALMYLPQGFAASVLVLGVLRVVQGIFQGGLASSINAMVVNSAPLDQAGVTIGLSTSAGSIGTALGPMLGSYLLIISTDRAVFLISGALFGMVALLVLLFDRRFTANADQV
ncbi:MAG: multidrug efflux MFS transporter [Chloroflexi bacterium]|nr:multidrug efflux MFS transporter [Chloroflexota bacterium]